MDPQDLRKRMLDEVTHHIKTFLLHVLTLHVPPNFLLPT
jgi:hypothetical protein